MNLMGNDLLPKFVPHTNKDNSKVSLEEFEIGQLISFTFPTVNPFDGVNAIEDLLTANNYVVVIDERNIFYGILTPSDLIERPHKLAIDCLTKKEKIFIDESTTSVVNKFHKNQTFALPVFQGNNLIGIIERRRIVDYLKIEIDILYQKSLISKKAKESFLQNLSHEVRTPLNGILGFIEILSKIEILNDSEKQYYDTIKDSADKFLLLINDLVELSLIHSGEKVPVKKELVCIEEIFSEIHNQFFSKLNKKLSITYVNPETSLKLYTDKKRMKQILYHLIDNAVKFSEGDKVIFGYRILKKLQIIMFYVKNTGPVIEKKNKNKIFEVFEKQEFFKSRCVDGLGIGLSLVKELVKLLDGKIDVISEKNKTTFNITFPIVTT